VLYLDGRPDMTMPGVGVNPNPPPFFDDAAGGVGVTLVFATNTAALAGGTGATSGGSEGTYPGTGAGYGTVNATVNNVGAVPASTSVAAEGAGSELTATATYAASVLVPGSAATYIPTGQTPAWAAGDPGGPTRTFGCGPTLPAPATTGVINSPNQSHASSLSKATNPALTSITPTTAVSGPSGTVALTAVTGTNFTPQSVVYANGVAIPTVYVSGTTLTATMPKKATAGTWPITVVTGGVVVTAPQTFTWT
jgi:hypothetical protein